MSVFHFKRFDVRNERSAMKVNTDGVLLGAVTEVLPGDVNVLDIGTGTGTVALMIAQRLDGLTRRHPSLHIHEAAPGMRDEDPHAQDDELDAQAEAWRIQGIDIDAPSAEEATENFGMSPWREHLEAENIGLTPFAMANPKRRFDLIVSNPPYFDNSLQAPEARRNTARHTGDPQDPNGAETLSYREILEYASTALSECGRVSMILPSDQEKALLRHARMCGFTPWKILRIKSVERKPFSRMIVQFRRKALTVAPPLEEALTLLDEKGKRTSQHASLVTDYYL